MTVHWGVWKLFSQSSTDVPRAMLPKDSLQNLLYRSFCLLVVSQCSGPMKGNVSCLQFQNFADVLCKCSPWWSGLLVSRMCELSIDPSFVPPSHDTTIDNLRSSAPPDPSSRPFGHLFPKWLTNERLKKVGRSRSATVFFTPCSREGGRRRWGSQF